MLTRLCLPGSVTGLTNHLFYFGKYTLCAMCEIIQYSVLHINVAGKERTVASSLTKILISSLSIKEKMIERLCLMSYVLRLKVTSARKRVI